MFSMCLGVGLRACLNVEKYAVINIMISRTDAEMIAKSKRKEKNLKENGTRGEKRDAELIAIKPRGRHKISCPLGWAAPQSS